MKRINKLAFAGIVLVAIMFNFGCSLNKAERESSIANGKSMMC